MKGDAVGDAAATGPGHMEVRERTVSAHGRDISLFIVAGEHSGDALGAKLMAALNQGRRGRIRYLGVGGAANGARRASSRSFPIEDVAVMGPAGDPARLPQILRRVYRHGQPPPWRPSPMPSSSSTARSSRIRLPSASAGAAPTFPIIDYVSPSVWAWRPGRARKMRDYVDHVLALLPFEPEAHARLRRPAVHLCGPSADRAPAVDQQRSIPRRWRERLGLTRDAAAGRAAGQPHARRSGG